MDKRHTRWVVITLFSLGMQLFIFRRFGSFGNVLFLGTLWALTIGLFGSFRRIGKPSLESYLTLFDSLILTTMLSVDAPFRSTLIVLGTLGSLIYAGYTLLRGYIPGSLLETVLAFPQTIGEYFASGLSTVSGSIPRQTARNSHKIQPLSPWLKSGLIGFAVGLPLVIWLTSLLSSADPVFASFVQHIVSKDLLEQLPVRTFVTLFAFVILVPTVFMEFKKDYHSPLAFLSRSSYGREACVVLAMVAGVLSTFLVVQWPYVFARVTQETSLSQFGVATYSEYVQKGFGELLMVAGIVTALSWVVLLVYRGERSDKIVYILKLLQLVLGVEFLIFVLSLIRRVVLYTQFHGLSLARLYGLAFLVWIVGMAVTLAARYFVKRGLLRWEIAWTLLLFLGTLSLNMQRLVLTRPPTVNGRVDYVYLSRLSGDGYDGWVQSYAWARDVVRREQSTTGILRQDDRRDLQYARMILDGIHSHYTHLTSIYGTSDEIARLDQGPYLAVKPIDRLFSWNAREQNIYGQIRNDISFTELTQLRDEVTALSKRISSQPEKEQDYPYDISFDTPLL